MALSNIFQEPRREIIETLVGIGIVAVFLYPDYLFGRWLQTISSAPPNDHGLPIPIGMVIGVVVLVLSFLLFVMIHFLGEETCDFLARRGLNLRPKDRY